MFLLSVVAFWAIPAQAGSVSFADLSRILNDPTRQVLSIDSLLAQPELDAYFRAGFTALFSSRSLQDATPLNPRILMYGEDSKLIMAFTCAPGNCVKETHPSIIGPDFANSNVLEVVEWQEASKSFEFHEIEFPEGRNGAVKISSPNPHKCMGCHMGPDPRPNWESYFHWPGAYGGNDDQLSGDLIEGESLERLNKFIEMASSRPRYRWLDSLAEGYQQTSVRDRRVHNIDITRALMRLNASRVADRIAHSVHYRDLKYAVVKSLEGTDLNVQLTSAGFPELGNLLDQCLHPSYAPGHGPDFIGSASRVVRLFHSLGEPALPWFMSFEPSVRSELVSPGDIDSDFLAAFRAQDPSLESPPDDIDKLIAEGWRQVALLPGLDAALHQCILDSTLEVR